MSYIKVSNIKLNINSTNEDAIKSAINRIGLDSCDVLDCEIVKLSIDARKKPDIKKIYTVGILTEKNVSSKVKDVSILNEKPSYKYKITGVKEMKNRPVIIGFGPAGMFASYLLAINGYKPIIIERGECVDNRALSVEKFWDTNELNDNSNVQFGEGGAGTFSDGKLSTGNKDKQNRIQFILDTFVKYGANDVIKYDFKPHIGTDALIEIVKNIREEIIKHGGDFYFNTKVVDISKKEIIKIKTNDMTFESDVVILAIGNAARDTFEMLRNNGFDLEAKPFAVGFRVEHKQKDINKNQYGFEDNRLGAAPYKLTYHSNSGRSVYSFCMCPGGYVVNSSSENNMLVVNGMSYSDRNGENANSAIVCSVSPDDFDSNDPLCGMKFQKDIEIKAYEEGNGSIPVQRYIDFKNNSISTSYGAITPNIKGKYSFGNLRNILPNEFCESLIEGIEYFGKKIEGFNDNDVFLSGIESRTSSPVRIIRDEDLQSNVKGIYPAGEGAGYAGGIVSSAVDGMKVFEEIISKYKPF